MLKNDTALITGAAGGIGRKIIEIFSQNGANIIACIRKQNKEFEKFCGDLETKYNNQIKIFSFDFNEDEKLTLNLESISKSYKKIDILVNNTWRLQTNYI